ncbi:MAG: LptF/LptG family permease, partial [Saprospiraceae bacterium]|nr:LptF/LptG family permease [Saprospiraceae bacterium]
MKKLDIYIIRKYLGAFLFTVLLFTLIALIFDFSDRVEKFIEHGIPVQEIIYDYYINFIPWINSILFPIYALIAVVFVTSRLANNSEFIAMLSAGVSFRRILLPYVGSALIIVAVHLVGNHIVIPNSNKVLKEFENTYIFQKNVKSKNKNVHLFTSPDTKIYLRYYRQKDTSGIDFRLEAFKDGELSVLLKANTIDWLGPPDRWRLKDYEMRTFTGDDETLYLGKGETIDTALNFTPQDFVYYTNQKEMMTTKELNEFIVIQEQKGAGGKRIYEVEKHRRTADPFTVLILTIIGVAVGGRKVRGGMGLHLAMGVVIGAIYIFLSKVSITFTMN